jgi:hypothetical protein
MIQILNQLNDINDKALNGEVSALKAYIECKTVEKLLKNVLKGLHEAAIDEATTYGKGEHEAHGAKFQVKNGAARYDFSKVAMHTEIKAQLKQCEESLKAILNSGKHNFADAETGEMVELPVKTYSADSITIKL